MALSISIRADATQFSRTIAGVRVEMSGLSGGIANVASGALGLAASLAKVGIGVAAVGGAMAAAFIKSSSDAASSMESLSVQFEVLTGSASKSAELIKAFREEAIKSPLSVSDYANAGKTLMAFGVSAESTLPILRTLGDVSMGNADRFASLSLAFAQTQAAGRLMGQEVLQFVNAGFNPLQEISRKTGQSMIELKKAMEDGAISSAMVSDAFKSATSEGGLFFGALEKGAETTEGRIAKLGDSILGLKVSFGTGFNEGLKVALDATSSYIPKLEERFSKMGQVLGTAVKTAVDEDYDLFVKAGVVIGEALKTGMKSTLDFLTDSILATPEMAKSGLMGDMHKFLQERGLAKYVEPNLGATIQSNSAGLKAAATDLSKTYEDKSVMQEQTKQLTAIRTAAETQNRLYRNAEARREKNILIGR